MDGDLTSEGNSFPCLWRLNIVVFIIECRELNEVNNHHVCLVLVRNGMFEIQWILLLTNSVTTKFLNF